MKSRVIAAFLAVELFAASNEYRVAAPGYQYLFPRDHFSHPEFQTEWWYYTGNLSTAQGRRFGFELTFFRQNTNHRASADAVWDLSDVWLAHLALSDIDGGQFMHTERLNRTGPGIAGADERHARVWNGNWEARWKLDTGSPGKMAAQHLQAVAEHFSLDLNLVTAKPPIIHGVNGISQKAEGAGRASHYISFTRLSTNGRIHLEGKDFEVKGTSWMDHEFFTHQLSPSQSGWDWFSLQFDDGSELMLFDLRRKDGAADPFSAGTYIDSQGQSIHLTEKEFSLTPGKKWKSKESGGDYPIEWNIRVPSLGIESTLTTRLPQQELTGKTPAAPNYWEGAIDISGKKNGKPLGGTGYLEMTGYAGAAPMAE